MPALTVHQSPWAGSWYPRSASELSSLLDGATLSSERRSGSFIRPDGIAFLVPHAAPLYSGTVAASVYRHIQATGANRIVILGFLHRSHLDGIAVPDVSHIATPFGSVSLDAEASDSLTASRPFFKVPPHRASDHSVEIQIPFIQKFVPGASIVPLYVGRLTAEERRLAATALRSLLDSRTALVASSDLTHFGSDFGYEPFAIDAHTGTYLRKLDTRVLAAASSLDHELFEQELSVTGATVCGRNPIRLMLETLHGLEREVFQDTLDYDTSGAMVGDYATSVSYGAAGYFPFESFRLGPAEQAELLQSARYALDAYGGIGGPSSLESLPLPSLGQKGRAFVTLWSQGDLRGCVGRFEQPGRLAEIVPELVIDAATSDPRFKPIEAGEAVEIEVHILTPLKRIRNPEQLQPGHHGGFLQSGSQRGLLLPSVAARLGLDREDFLKLLARKAGLPESIYSTGNYELSVFRDQSFREGAGGIP